MRRDHCRPPAAVLSLLLLTTLLAGPSRSGSLYEFCLFHGGQGNGVCEPFEQQSNPPLVVEGGPVATTNSLFSYSGALGTGEIDAYVDEDAFGFTDLFTQRSLRSKMRFDDIVFSDGTGETGSIAVSLNLFLEGSYEAIRESGSGELCYASFEVLVQSSSEGVWIPASADNFQPATGMFAGLVADELDGVFTTSSFSVAKNEPVSVEISLESSARASLALIEPGTRARSVIDFRSGSRRVSLPSAVPVFNVPPGFTVASDQANIVDNEWLGNVATAASPAAVPRAVLDPAVPNPFRPETRISFSLRDEMPVRLEVYDLRGRRVASLVNDRLPAGRHSIRWNGTDRDHRRVSSGIYFYRLTAADFVQTRKVALVR